MGKTDNTPCDIGTPFRGATLNMEKANADLSLVRSVSFDAARKVYMVTVMINGEETQIQLDPSGNPPRIVAPDSTDPQILKSALAAAIGRRSMVHDGSDQELELADLLSEMEDLSPDSREYSERQKRANELANLILEKTGPVQVTHAESQAQPDRSVRVSRRVAAKRRAEELSKKLRSAIENAPAGSSKGLDLLLNETIDQNQVERQETERREAAVALGGVEEDDGHISNIPRVRAVAHEVDDVDEDGNPYQRVEFTGDLIMSETFMDATHLWHSRVVKGGTRLVVYKGPPSTGKDTHVEEMAASLKMPLVTRNAGPNYDIQDMLGGEGVGPVTTYDKDGNPIGTSTGSKKIVGSLLEACQYPCIYVITEPEGIEDDLPRLNTLFGAKVGEPDKRTVSAGSISDDEEITPHPDFMVAITYNPGHSDIKLPSSVHNRALNLSFEYPEKEEEYKIVAKSVKSIFKNDIGPFKDHEPDPEEVKPCVDLVRGLRDLHRTNPTSWIDQPDMRQAAHLYNDLVYAGRRGATDDEVLRLVRKSLDFCQPGSMKVDPETRAKDMDDLVADYASEFFSIAQKGSDMQAGA